MTSELRLHYYPYASFTSAQLPLLKVAALYFDKMYILDPRAATWDSIGLDEEAHRSAELLQQEGILQVLDPAQILTTYSHTLAQMVREDMQDDDYLTLCDRQAQATGKRLWTLALVKVPQDILMDSSVRQLMGSTLRGIAAETAHSVEAHFGHWEGRSCLPGNRSPVPGDVSHRAEEYRSYADRGRVYDEYREHQGFAAEYRYVDVPLALGESVMVNHALLAGLVWASATPVTDDAFHEAVLRLKMRRAAQNPQFQQAVSGKLRARRARSDLLATTAILDPALNLPILNPELPLDEVLAYRYQSESDLVELRRKLAAVARRIETDPWSEDFERYVEHKAIPEIMDLLEQARKVRDAWLKSRRGRLALSAAGIATGAAAAVLTLVAAPVTPIALAAAGLGLASSSALPGLQWLSEWREGQPAQAENGLSYLLKL